MFLDSCQRLSNVENILKFVKSNLKDLHKFEKVTTVNSFEGYNVEVKINFNLLGKMFYK